MGLMVPLYLLLPHIMVLLVLLFLITMATIVNQHRLLLNLLTSIGLSLKKKKEEMGLAEKLLTFHQLRLVLYVRLLIHHCVYYWSRVEPFHYQKRQLCAHTFVPQLPRALNSHTLGVSLTHLSLSHSHMPRGSFLMHSAIFCYNYIHSSNHTHLIDVTPIKLIY